MISDYVGGWHVSTASMTEKPPYYLRRKVMQLYKVYFVNGEDRKNPKVQEKLVFGMDSDEAKIAANFDISGIDSDFITILAVPICEVKIKPRPTEVKNVE